MYIAILIIQCDPVASSSQRIQHAKYIIEQERAEYIHRVQQNQQKELEKDKKQEPADPEKDKGKLPEQVPQPPKRVAKYRHVLVLVHLNRGYSSASFAFDFERNWFATFLDDIKVTLSLSPPFPFSFCFSLTRFL